MPRFNTANVSGNTIRIKGYQNVLRAYKRVGKSADKNMRRRLKEAAEPVREAAQEYGPGRIRNLRHGRSPSGANWSGVRTGVTTRWVYIAPVERGIKGHRDHPRRRPNFRDLMMDRAYFPALEDNRTEVVERFDKILDDIVDAWVVG